MLRLRTFSFIAAPFVLSIAGCNGSMNLPPGSASPANALQSNASVLAAKRTFVTLDNQTDPTFNQLLGIDSDGKIAGYYGIGSKKHPNKGYTLVRPYKQTNYTNENFPGSVQTQVTGLNDLGDTCGFWVDKKGDNFGFIEWNNVFTSYRDPKTGHGTVNQLLGINNAGIAVGFYVDGNGVSHGYLLNHKTGKFTEVKIPGGTNVTVAGINARGDITGFYTGSNKMVVGFIRKAGSISSFTYPNSTSTTPLGINIHDEIVGAYTDSSEKMHGFLLGHPITGARWETIDDPHGKGTTTINGLNDKALLVGFYVDGDGNTDGMLVKP